MAPHTPLPATPQLRALDGRRAGELTLVLPRTAADLDRWGRLLSSCVGDFAAAVVAGRSHLVGVLRANRLAYVLELTPGGEVRQFCGRANRRPPAAVRRAVLELIDASGAPSAAPSISSGTPAPGPSAGR